MIYIFEMSQQVKSKKRSWSGKKEQQRKQKARANMSPNTKAAQNRKRRVQWLMRRRKISREAAEFIVANKSKK